MVSLVGISSHTDDMAVVAIYSFYIEAVLHDKDFLAQVSKSSSWNVRSVMVSILLKSDQCGSPDFRVIVGNRLPCELRLLCATLGCMSR
jgi:hypothetical protein